jgi:hypothetical protein
LLIVVVAGLFVGWFRLFVSSVIATWPSAALRSVGLSVVVRCLVSVVARWLFVICSVISSGLSVCLFAAVLLFAGLVCWFGCSLFAGCLLGWLLVCWFLLFVVCCHCLLSIVILFSLFVGRLLCSVGSLLRLFVCFVGFVVITGWFGCLLAGCSLPLSPARLVVVSLSLFVVGLARLLLVARCSVKPSPACSLRLPVGWLLARRLPVVVCRFVARLVAARLPLSSTRSSLPDGIQARLEGITHIPQIIITSF